MTWNITITFHWQSNQKPGEEQEKLYVPQDENIVFLNTEIYKISQIYPELLIYIRRVSDTFMKKK